LILSKEEGYFYTPLYSIRITFSTWFGTRWLSFVFNANAIANLIMKSAAKRGIVLFNK